jgi:uncharacterized membrane protein YoaK (UPF0700 family)
MPYSHPQPFEKHNAFKQVRLLVPGAFALAASAGFINSVALGFFHTPVSHMTGAISHFSMDTAGGRWPDAFSSLTIILGFLAGAVLNGLIIGAWKLIPGRRYGFGMIVEGCLLGLATYLLLHKQRLALPAVSMACGMQNAMSSSYCGLMIRTTHVTGIVTDIGVMIGHWFRHRQIEAWKLRFLLLIVGAFGAGCWLGQIADSHFGPSSLALPAVGFIIAGTVLAIVYHHRLVDLLQDAKPTLPTTASFPKH